MTTIFGYDTLNAEIVGLINQANANFGAQFGPNDLQLTLGDFDLLESRQRFTAKDLTGKYFGVIDDLGIFKRSFQTLFKGIDIHVQVGSGETNREVAQLLCTQQGLPPFDDSDFAPGLLDLNTPANDTEILVQWPFAATSWGWTGSLNFYLRNSKNSLATLIPDGDTAGLDPVPLSGITWQVPVTALNGINPPIWNDLNQVITATDLPGLEYPGDNDLNLLISVTDLPGLEYPGIQSLNDLSTDLSGLDYFPALNLTTLSGSLTGLDYPMGTLVGKASAYVLTQCLDFSDYENAIAALRVGSEINDPNLVNVIVGKIAAQWPAFNTQSSVTKLTTCFSGSDVTSITRTRHYTGWTVSVTLALSTQSFLSGSAVLKYNIETV